MKLKIKEGDFKKVINEAILENRHVDYLNEVLKKYDEYKKAFNGVFTEQKGTEAEIYLFRVKYLNKKSVWRDIEVLNIQTFYDLANKIIESMDWQNDHMHGFEFPGEIKRPDSFFTGSSIAFFAPGWEDDPHPTFKTDEIRVCDINYKKMPKLNFTFDYGDGHMFEIIFKKVRDIKNKKEIKEMPRVINMHGIAPEQYPDYK